MHKTKPENQAGMINGLGGKIEDGETAIDCMVREIREESGLVTKANSWIHLGLLRGSDWSVEVFGTIYQGSLSDAHSLEAQTVEWFDIKNLPDNVLHNLHWLIPLAIDKLKHGDFLTASIEYSD